MAISTTIKQLKQLLDGLTSDLDKAISGNKAASQRVRTGTIRLEKIARLFRKESLVAERTGLTAGGTTKTTKVTTKVLT